MMGTMVYFCAGADANNLPVSPIEALLINALDHGSTPQKITGCTENVPQGESKSFNG
jgi:hypothetical protein